MTVLNNVIYWFLLEVKFVKFGPKRPMESSWHT